MPSPISFKVGMVIDQSFKMKKNWLPWRFTFAFTLATSFLQIHILSSQSQNKNPNNAKLIEIMGNHIFYHGKHQKLHFFLKKWLLWQQICC
jgi:hypothetical protein